MKFEASADDVVAIAASGNSLLLKWRAMFCWLPPPVGFGFGFGFGFISCLSPSCSGHWVFPPVCIFPLLFFLGWSVRLFPFGLFSFFFCISYFKSFLWCIIRLPAVDSVDGTKCSAIHFNGRRRPPVISTNHGHDHDHFSTPPTSIT